MTKTETRGGARINAGRKPVQDKKQQISLFIAESKIKKHGGADKLRAKIYKLIEK